MSNISKVSKRKKAYVPPNAGIDLSNVPQDPPRVRYENNKATFNRKIVNQITRGRYGNYEF